MTQSPVPEYLHALLRHHGRAHSPHYPPHGHADHGPMAYLALWGLGAPRDVVEGFARRYRRQLAPLASPAGQLHAGSLRDAVGQAGAYPELLRFFASEVERKGWEAVLLRYLPQLASGWARDAFHPLIRLGYAIEHGIASEVAAGLAYLACVGDDPRLERAARRPHSRVRGRAFLGELRALRNDRFVRGSFGRRYSQVMTDAALSPSGAPDEALRELARASLEVFHATGDFFALHLVTASHAARLCAPFAGPDFPSLYSVGVAAGYLAIGAPEVEPIAPGNVEHDGLGWWKPGVDVDEHDVKCAYSCRALGEAYGDPAYSWVVGQYLRSRAEAA